MSPLGACRAVPTQSLPLHGMENERHGGLFVMSTTRFSTSASTSPVQWRLVLVDLAPLMLPACL